MPIEQRDASAPHSKVKQFSNTANANRVAFQRRQYPRIVRFPARQRLATKVELGMDLVHPLHVWAKSSCPGPTKRTKLFRNAVLKLFLNR